MIMDIIILIIFIATAAYCVWRGFAATIVGFLQGIVSLIAAYFLCGLLGDYIKNNTNIGTFIEVKIRSTLSYKWEESDVFKALPSLFKKGSQGFTDDLISDGSAKIASIIISILSFVIILILIRLFLSLLLRLFSHKYQDGLVGCMDRLLGCLIGVFLGAFFVLAFLALLFPIIGIVAPSQYDLVMSWFDGSRIAKDLYDNNLLLILYRDFFMKG